MSFWFVWVFGLVIRGTVLFVGVAVEACDGVRSDCWLVVELGTELSRLKIGRVAVSLRVFLLLRWLERERDLWWLAESGLSVGSLEAIMMSDFRLAFLVRLSDSALSMEEELPLAWLTSLSRVISVV